MLESPKLKGKTPLNRGLLAINAAYLDLRVDIDHEASQDNR